MTETLLARLCAPALAGIKPSNLAAISKSAHPQCHSELAHLNCQFAARGIRFDVVCECESKLLVLVYRTDVLARCLKAPDNAGILRLFGYDTDGVLTQQLDRLRERMSFGDFPHEIGVFLGYPAEDVLGFLKDRRQGVLLVGEWKVYADVDRAKKLFSRYAACRKAVLRRMENGHSLSRIFCAA